MWVGAFKTWINDCLIKTYNSLFYNWYIYIYIYEHKKKEEENNTTGISDQKQKPGQHQRGKHQRTKNEQVEQ